MYNIKKALQLFNKRDKRNLVILISMLIIAAMLETVGIGLIMPLIALLNQPEIIETNKWFSLAFAKSGASSYQGFLILVSSFMIIYYLLKNLLVGTVIYAQSRFLSNKEARTRSELLKKYLSMNYTDYLKRNTSELVANINTETYELFFNFISPGLILLAETLVALFIFTLLLIVAPEATLLSLGGLGIVSAAFYIYIRKSLNRLGKQRQNNISKMILWVNQGLGSLKELTILDRKDYFHNHFASNAHQFAKANTMYQTVNQLPRIIIESFAVIMLLVITIAVLHGEEGFLPILSLFAMSAFRLMPSVNRITVCATRLKYYSHSLDKVYADMIELPNAEIEAANNASINFDKQIELEDICFKYPDSDKMVINDLNLTIKKGESVGIIGPSGAGKSTLVDLLLGLLRPTEGNIKIDGVNIEDNIKDWRKYVSYMPQFIYLIDDTIKRNIALGLDDDEIDDEKINQAIQMAELEEFINSLPEGLDTIVGEQGTRLSGGQRQRIGIARSLYNEPEVLILDEATTALDPDTEKSICDTLKSMKKDNLTLITISHQSALTDITDRVYRL